MKKKMDNWSASPDEFKDAVESELKFLCDQFGYRMSWNKENLFEASFYHEDTEIKVTGINYGFASMVTLIVKGEVLPLWAILPNLKKRLTPTTNKPQLDDIREYAYRLNSECRDILTGDFSRLYIAREALAEQERKIEEKRQADKKGLFFSKADKLWKNKEFDKLHTHLNASPYKLSKSWQKRLEYTEKHV